MFTLMTCFPEAGTSSVHEKSVNGGLSDSARNAPSHAIGRERMLDRLAAIAEANDSVTANQQGRVNSRHYAVRPADGTIAVVKLYRKWVQDVNAIASAPELCSYRVRFKRGNHGEAWVHPSLFPPKMVRKVDSLIYFAPIH